MNPDELRAALRHYRHSAWSVVPEMLPRIADAFRRGATERTDAEIIPEPGAALGSRVQSTGGVAVIPLKGLITKRPSFISLLFGGGGGLQSFRSAFREALGSEEIGSILIDIDSPGGSTDLISETAAEIRAARGTKPVIAISNTLAASAAYWIAAQADEIIVTPSGEVGSIGVFAVHEDWSGFNEAMGVMPTYVSAGRFKTELNPDEPLSEEAKAALQATVDEFYELFVIDVAAGRGASVDAVRNGYGEGRVVTAQRAVALGMADRVETYEATVARLAGRPRSPEQAVATAGAVAQDENERKANRRALRLAQPRHAR